jgi:hypothetical protein
MISLKGIEILTARRLAVKNLLRGVGVLFFAVIHLTKFYAVLIGLFLRLVLKGGITSCVL